MLSQEVFPATMLKFCYGACPHTHCDDLDLRRVSFNPSSVPRRVSGYI